MVHSNFTYDSEAYDLIKLYLETSHSESSRTTVEIVNVLKQLVIFAGELHRGCFDRILNATLPNNLM